MILNNLRATTPHAVLEEPNEIEYIKSRAHANAAWPSRAVWDGRWSAEQFQFAFDDLDAEASPINYVTFAQGTVIPAGETTAGASGHRNTWRIAYTIEPIREWIFRQHR